MRPAQRRTPCLAAIAGRAAGLAIALVVLLAAATGLAPSRIGSVARGSTMPASSSAGSGGSGGAPVGGLAPTRRRKVKLAPVPSRHAAGRWLSGVAITEYWPAPEAWFAGRLVRAPGLTGLHRIDWLYSATGLSMQGSGIGLDGRLYHIGSLGHGGWVTAAGRSTSPSDGWQAGSPFWRAGGYWRNRFGAVTFPLATGGWSAGPGRHHVPLRDVSFAPGLSLPLHYYQSLAVDPSAIPLGSRVYVPAYRHDGYGGWFIAQDTGGAINGRHIDIYRPPPVSATDGGQLLLSRRIYVIAPRR